MSTYLYGSAVIDPASLTTGISVGNTVTVTGAALGDFCQVSFDIDTVDVTVTASVTAANTVTVLYANVTAGTLNLGSATARVMVTSFAGQHQS